MHIIKLPMNYPSLNTFKRAQLFTSLQSNHPSYRHYKKNCPVGAKLYENKSLRYLYHTQPCERLTVGQAGNPTQPKGAYQPGLSHLSCLDEAIQGNGGKWPTLFIHSLCPLSLPLFSSLSLPPSFFLSPLLFFFSWPYLGVSCILLLTYLTNIW